MKKLSVIFLFLSVLILLSGCDGVNEILGGPDGLWSDYDSYLSYSDFTLLVNKLSSESSIDRDEIDRNLEEMKVSQNYEYSLYTSGNYVCHTLLWSEFSTYSYDWVYYVSVDIWTDGYGTLREDMCSYYAD